MFIAKSEREREREREINWLLTVHSMTRDWICNVLIYGRCSNQLSRPGPGPNSFLYKGHHIFLLVAIIFLVPMTSHSLALSDLPNSTFLIRFIRGDCPSHGGLLTDFSPVRLVVIFLWGRGLSIHSGPPSALIQILPIFELISNTTSWLKCS